MEVSVSALRAGLKDWIEAARQGEEVVITDRGIPVARLSGVRSADLLTRLQREGLLTGPTGERPAAERPLTPAHHDHPERPTGPSQALSDLKRRLRR